MALWKVDNGAGHAASRTEMSMIVMLRLLVVEHSKLWTADRQALRLSRRRCPAQRSAPSGSEPFGGIWWVSPNRGPTGPRFGLTHQIPCPGPAPGT